MNVQIGQNTYPISRLHLVIPRLFSLTDLIRINEPAPAVRRFLEQRRLKKRVQQIFEREVVTHEANVTTVLSFRIAAWFLRVLPPRYLANLHCRGVQLAHELQCLYEMARLEHEQATSAPYDYIRYFVCLPGEHQAEYYRTLGTEERNQLIEDLFATQTSSVDFVLLSDQLAAEILAEGAARVSDLYQLLRSHGWQNEPILRFILTPAFQQFNLDELLPLASQMAEDFTARYPLQPWTTARAARSDLLAAVQKGDHDFIRKRLQLGQLPIPCLGVRIIRELYKAGELEYRHAYVAMRAYAADMVIPHPEHYFCRDVASDTPIPDQAAAILTWSLLMDCELDAGDPDPYTHGLIPHLDLLCLVARSVSVAVIETTIRMLREAYSSVLDLELHLALEFLQDYAVKDFDRMRALGEIALRDHDEFQACVVEWLWEVRRRSAL